MGGNEKVTVNTERVARKSLKKIDKKEQLKILSVINDIQECETIQNSTA